MTVFSEHTITAVIPGIEYEVTPGFTTDYPAEEVYFGDFEDGDVDGWVASGGGSTIRVDPALGNYVPHSGDYMLFVSGVGAAPHAQREFAGLTVGRSYTLEGWVRIVDDRQGTAAGLGVAGKGSISVTPSYIYPFPYSLVSYTFTATATSHTAELRGAATGGHFWDDITLTRNAYSVVTPPIIAPDYPLNVTSSTVTLDEGNVPYARVELECAMPREDVLEQLNPFDDLRLLVTLEQSFDDWNPSTARLDQSRTFDLTVAARDVDYSEGTLSITAGSDEFLLQMFTLVAEEPTVLSTLSVKDIVDYALDQIGATLAPGASDGTLDNTDPVTLATNLLLNPSVEVTADNWLSGAASTTIARSGTESRSGTTSLRCIASSGTSHTAFMHASGGFAALPDETFTASVYIKLTSGTGTATVTVRSATAANVTLTNYSGTPTTVNSTGWTRVYSTATLAGATVGKVNAYVSITGVTTSRHSYLDDAMLNRGTLTTYFDGETAPSGLDYYEWKGDPHASESVHLFKANSFTTWEPGESAWDYVSPAVQSTGLRLWADEHRVWHLDAPGVAVPGALALGEGENVTEASDSISVLDDSDYFDGVVITYRWTDLVTGLEVIKRDVAGVSGKSYTATIERPYPGAGAAQAILDRAAGKGRVFAVEALSSYTATPGQPVTIALPSSPTQLGVITTVSWELPAARMTVGTRGLTDIPDEAWLLAPPARTWSAAPGTWITYTN